jgi:hypothetical protein
MSSRKVLSILEALASGEILANGKSNRGTTSQNRASSPLLELPLLMAQPWKVAELMAKATKPWHRYLER